nr:MAG TPA: hypothetical protein [Caudoviricetes sp.]
MVSCNPFKNKKPHDVRPFPDLSLQIKIAIGTTGFEPVTSQFPKQDLIRLPYIH